MHAITRSCVLLLWMHTLTFVKSQDCTLEDFLNGPVYDSHFNTTDLMAIYQNGKEVGVSCNVGYSGFFNMICVEGKWQFRGSKCQPHQCPVVHVDNNVLVNGDPEEATYGNVVRFSCKSSIEILSGPSEIFCDENGQWSDQPAKCEAIECTVPTIQNGRVPATKKKYKEHEILHFECDPLYQRVNDRPSKCTKLGSGAEWSPTPLCDSITCDREDVPNADIVHNNKQTYRFGEEVIYVCKEGFKGRLTLTCRDGALTGNRQCTQPLDCGTPPFLADGDIKYSVKSQYSHSESVEYMCQRYYTMEGEPNKTCNNGEWTGQMRCIKPCIVNDEDIRQHNITLKSSDNTFFAHDELIEFRCARGVPVGAVAMHQRCNGGVILLPTCRDF